MIGIVENIDNNMRDLVFDIDGENFDRVYEQSEWIEVQKLLLGNPTPRYMLSSEERNKRFIHESISTFENFINESIKTEVPFIISERLEGLLFNIKHPIAKRMISESNNIITNTTEATLIDYDEKDTNKFTFTTSSKFTDALKNTLNIEYSTAHIPTLYDIMKVNKELYEELRTSIKIGRLVNKLYPSEYTPNGENSIEDFVNAVKLSRNRKFDNFEIVTGKDIIKYYYRDNYDDEAFNGSELGNSCMGYDWCESFINFYKINPSVSLLILRSETDNNKIVGRALIWDLDTVDGKKVKGKFMDRIYYTKNYQKELFIEHARDNEWYHYLNGAKIWNPNVKDYFKKFIVISTVKTFVENPLDVYPYMDTMMFYFPNSMFLSNSSLYSEETGEDYYYLQNTEGGYSVDNDGEDSDW